MTWATIQDLYTRFGDEFVDKLADRRKWDESIQAYVADQSRENRDLVIQTALDDAKALLKQKLSCAYQNISILDEQTFSCITQWHIQLTISVLKAGGDCVGCKCEGLDDFLKCGSICSDDGTCLVSKSTFFSVSIAHFPCESCGCGESRCSCC